MAIMLPAALARTESGAVTVCRFEPAGVAKVRAISDGRSLILEDGREIRLAGIEVPLLPAAGESGPDAEAALAVRAALAAMVVDRTVELRPLRPHARARHVAGAEARRSVAHEMLARGFARVAAHIGDRACAEELLAQERSARRAKLGLWSEPYYVIVAADSAAELSAARGRFTLVEGKVWSVRESAGTIYINFGPRWGQALTVTISKRDESGFTAAGVAPKTLEARRLRVRGWVEERNGPRIDATRPEQIEIAERN